MREQDLIRVGLVDDHAMMSTCFLTIHRTILYIKIF
jgi:hypothetical protein